MAYRGKKNKKCIFKMKELLVSTPLNIFLVVLEVDFEVDSKAWMSVRISSHVF